GNTLLLAHRTVGFSFLLQTDPFDRIIAEYLDGTRHCSDFVTTACIRHLAIGVATCKGTHGIRDALDWVGDADDREVHGSQTDQDGNNCIRNGAKESTGSLIF